MNDLKEIRADVAKIMEAPIEDFPETWGGEWFDHTRALLALVDDLKADNQRLREALRKIGSFTNGHGDVAGIVNNMARGALQEGRGDE